jgi:hypothetical protein
MEALASAIRKEVEIMAIQIREEEIKKSLFTDNSKECTKIAEPKQI